MRRVEARSISGWASEKREVYKPLGAPEYLPHTGPEVRRRKMGEYQKPRVVQPQAQASSQQLAQMTQSARLESTSQRLTTRS